MTETVRVALYTRVSTEDQAKEGFSLDAQMHRLELYAASQGWEVVSTYVDDGHSGRNTRRPAYQRMMDERERWDQILVLKMDRIHRNSRNFMAMMDQLTKEDKGFASVTENLDTSTAMGRFVMDIIQRIAQLESEQIGERVQLGMEQKAKSGGGSLGKPAPFGYAYGPGAKLIVVEEERGAAASIFQGFLGGEGKQAIADRLNASGHVTRKGLPFTIWSLNRILTNPTYAGALRWEGIYQLSQHEAIVSPRLWDDVQDRYAATTRSYEPEYLTRLNT